MDLSKHTADIVSAYVSTHEVAADALPSLIGSVYRSLGTLTSPEAEPDLQPAVSIRKSVTPDYLICLEDGRKLKMLKRHLSTAYGMTPEEYRARWGLPPTYPMIAPSYAAQRSELARKIGLGLGSKGMVRKGKGPGKAGRAARRGSKKAAA